MFLNKRIKRTPVPLIPSKSYILRKLWLFVLSVACFILMFQAVIKFEMVKNKYFGSDFYIGNQMHSVKQELSETSNSDTKYILYWNSAYESTKYGFCCGQKPFLEYNCPVSNCFATDDRNYFGDKASKFDAILFHQRSLEKDDLPKIRTSSQRYIMFMLESAQYPFSFER